MSHPPYRSRRNMTGWPSRRPRLQLYHCLPPRQPCGKSPPPTGRPRQMFHSQASGCSSFHLATSSSPVLPPALRLPNIQRLTANPLDQFLVDDTHSSTPYRRIALCRDAPAVSISIKSTGRSAIISSVNRHACQYTSPANPSTTRSTSESGMNHAA